MAELEAAIAALDDDGIERSISGETTRVLHWLASSNYRTSFPTSIDISERVLFPSGPTESQGMEDARFVRFVDDDGRVDLLRHLHRVRRPPDPAAADRDRRLRATSASPRSAAAPPTTRAWRSSRAGSTARYVALGRHDNVNNFIMTSTDVRVWRDADAHPGTRATLGADAARQLRIAARDRGRLARDHPRRRPVPALHARRAPARPRRPEPGDRSPEGTVAQPRRRRARRLRAQRRVLVRQHDPRRAPRAAVRLRRRRGRASPRSRSTNCSAG